MAQPSFDSILNAVMQAESGGRRYDSRGNLLTSDKGAKGEMQVLDATKFDPGFGVEPAKQNTPDERARVGRDYLKAMLDRYGNVDKALAAYNWGPGNTDKWIAKGADPAKLPAETQGYISKIKSSLAGAPRTTAQATPEAAPAVAPARGAPAAAMPTVTKVGEARPADMGPSYQAALALSFLSDEDEKESGRREYDERQPSAASQWLARETRRVTPESLALSFRSPFPEPEPVRAAGGGFIAVGYKDGGEAKTEEWKDGPPPELPPEEPFIPGLSSMRPKERTAKDMLRQAYRSARDFVEDAPLTPMAIGMEGALMLADQYNLMPPHMRQLMREERAKRLARRDLRRQGYEDGGEAKSDELTPEERERLSKPAFGVVPSSGKGRKQSRVSEALQSGEAQLAAAKGLTMLPQNVVGAPVDIATLLMRPFGYNVEKPVGGSDYLKEKSRQAGVAFQESQDPTLRGFFTAGDIASNLINPAGATRTAVRGVEKTGEAAKMLAQMAAQDPTVSRTVESAIERIAPAAAPMYAVRPKGGHFAAKLQRDSSTGEIKLVTDPVGEYVKKRLADTGDDALNNWFERRIGSYLRNQVGSEADPFVQAAQQGRKTHHLFVTNPNEPFEVPSALREMRKAEGFPELGMATNPIAMRLESRSDKAIFPQELQDLPEKLVPPQLKKFVETDPSMRAYLFNYDALNNLELRALRDEMLAMRSQPKEYSKHGVSLNVPEQYRLSDQMLQGLSPDRASELVTNFRFWKRDADGRLASKAVRTNPDITRVELPGGYMWAEAPDLAKSDKTLELVKDLGCSVGWCTKDNNWALTYGSGKNRLSVLMSPKGQAQAQLTISTPKPGFVRVSEIQGAFSTDDIRDAPYVSKVQDYVKLLDKKHNLLDVSDLGGIGMTDLERQVRYMAKWGEIRLDQQSKILQEAIQLNGGSRFVNIINKADPAGVSDYSELNNILKQAAENVSKQ